MNIKQVSGTILCHILLFIALCAVFAWQSRKCVAQYMRGDSSVLTLILDASTLRYPAVAINPGFNIKELEQLGLTQEDYISGRGWGKNQKKPEDVYKMVTSALADVLTALTVSYHDGRVVEENPHQPMETKKERSGNLGESYLFIYQRYGYDKQWGMTWSRGMGVSKMVYKFKNTADFGAMTISVQHPGRLFAPEIMLSTFQITGGVRNVVTVRHSVTLMRNKPDHTGLTGEPYLCVPTPLDEEVEFDDCQEDYIRENLKNQVNCRVPWFRDPDMPVCDPSIAMNASKIYFKSMESPPCLQPCCTKEIDIVNKFLTESNDNSTILELRFPPTIKEHIEMESYSATSCLAEVGGFLGMFLGLSFWDLKLLVDFVSELIKKKKMEKPVMVTPIASN